MEERNDGKIIDRDVERKDVNVIKIPATELALNAGLSTLANMVIMGKIIKETGLYTLDEIKLGLEKSIPPSKAALFDKNVKAVEIGYNYEG